MKKELEQKRIELPSLKDQNDLAEEVNKLNLEKAPTSDKFVKISILRGLFKLDSKGLSEKGLNRVLQYFSFLVLLVLLALILGPNLIEKLINLIENLA